MAATWVRYSSRPVAVRFLARPNRYLAIVRREAGGGRFEAHVPNPGRMEELLIPGATTGFVVSARSPSRRTRYDLVAVRHGRALVSIDSRIANRVVRQALAWGTLAWARGYRWLPEQRFGKDRFDFAGIGVRDPKLRALLEVKSSNLRVGLAAWFPDAPTERGRRHLEGLIEAVRLGLRADVLFAVQRADIREFRANRELDPAFASALARARGAGVGMHAMKLRVRPGAVGLGRSIPIR